MTDGTMAQTTHEEIAADAISDHPRQSNVKDEQFENANDQLHVMGRWITASVAVILGVALIAFIVQNTRSVQVKFFGASGHLPVAVALLAALLIGAIIVLGVGIWRSTSFRIAARRRWTRKTEEEAFGPNAETGR